MALSSIKTVLVSEPTFNLLTKGIITAEDVQQRVMPVIKLLMKLIPAISQQKATMIIDSRAEVKDKLTVDFQLLFTCAILISTPASKRMTTKTMEVKMLLAEPKKTAFIRCGTGPTI